MKYFFILLIIFIISCNSEKAIHNQKTYNIDDSITCIQFDTNSSLEPILDPIDVTILDTNIILNNCVSCRNTKQTKQNNKKLNIPLDSNINTNIETDDIIIKTNTGLMYHIKYDTMFVGISKEFNLIISKKVLSNNTINEIFTSQPISKKIKVSNKIKTGLVDPVGTNFDIVYIGSETKQFLDSSYNIWTWYVTPLVKGENKLILYVEIFEDGEINGHKTYTDIITVISNDNIITKILIFFKTYWQWFIGSIILPFIFFMWKSKKNKN